jgi:hypothetical protein
MGLLGWGSGREREDTFTFKPRAIGNEWSPEDDPTAIDP